MASDGCQDMGRGQMPIYGVQGCWVNQNKGHSYPSYTDVRHQSSAVEKGNTGTWHGPAPVGNPHVLGIAHDPTPTPEPARAKPGPRDVLLPSGSRIPYMAYCTEGAAQKDVEECLTIGFRHLECSPEYGNQSAVGAALKSVPREDLFISSRLSNDQHRNAEEACKATLRELGVEYLDLYLISWPVTWKAGTQEVDADWTIEMTWKAMEALVEGGLVRNIGVANFSLPEVERVLQACKVKPAVLQVELHPRLAQRKLVGVCKRLGLKLFAHHPLGSKEVDCLGPAAAAASSSGRTATQVVLQWNLQRGCGVVASPHTSPVPAPPAELFGAIEFCLTNDEKCEMDRLNTDRRSFEPPWAAFAHPEEGGAAKPSVVIGY